MHDRSESLTAAIQFRHTGHVWHALTRALALALVAALTIGTGTASAQTALPPAMESASGTDASAPPMSESGGGDINFTRQLASKAGSFGYGIGHVTKAGRFDYRHTTVYFEPGGEALARRLASQLGCGTVGPLPGGKNPRRLVVIAGPPSAAC